MHHQAPARQSVNFTAAFLLLSGLIPLDEARFQKLIRSLRGRVALVEMWATWCAPCRERLPAIAAIQERYPALRLITISADQPDNAAHAWDALQEAQIHL